MRYKQGEKQTSNARMKARFRQSVKWQEFRQHMKELQDGRDYITRLPLRKGWNLHHADLHPQNYQILNEDNFFCLGSQTHDYVHWLYSYYKKDPSIIIRLVYVLDKMKELENKEVIYEEERD